MKETPNSALKIDKIPDPDKQGCDCSWVKFAHTINGYEAAGGFAECAELVEPGRAKTLTELRCALFFMSRADRHSGTDSTDCPELHALLRKIRAKVQAREFD
jgi:hypothetical protein